MQLKEGTTNLQRMTQLFVEELRPVSITGIGQAGGLFYRVREQMTNPLPHVKPQPTQWGYFDLCQLNHWHLSKKPCVGFSCPGQKL